MNAELPVLRIGPSGGGVWSRLRELWEYRELLFFLTWRDVSVRYKQTALGAAWAVLQPALTMAVFSIFFGGLAKVPSDGIPYPLFAFCGLLPWQLFAYALNSSANSLLNNERLVTKVYFPRLALPLAAVLAGLVDFAVAFAVLVGMMLYYGIVPGAGIFALPLLLLFALAAAVSVGFGLAALNVRFRDVRYVLPFLTQLWMFVTPIAYPSSLVPEPWRPVYGLNPMAGVVEGFRWALLGRPEAPGAVVLASVASVCLALVASTAYFLRVERNFADVI